MKNYLLLLAVSVPFFSSSLTHTDIGSIKDTIESRHFPKSFAESLGSFLECFREEIPNKEAFLASFDKEITSGKYEDFFVERFSEVADMSTPKGCFAYLKKTFLLEGFENMEKSSSEVLQSILEKHPIDIKKMGYVHTYLSDLLEKLKSNSLVRAQVKKEAPCSLDFFLPAFRIRLQYEKLGLKEGQKQWNVDSIKEDLKKDKKAALDNALRIQELEEGVYKQAAQEFLTKIVNSWSNLLKLTLAEFLEKVPESAKSIKEYSQIDIKDLDSYKVLLFSYAKTLSQYKTEKEFEKDQNESYRDWLIRITPDIKDNISKKNKPEKPPFSNDDVEEVTVEEVQKGNEKSGGGFLGGFSLW